MKSRILILIIFSLIIYSNSLFNSFVWVDHTQIVQKEHIIQDFNGLVNVFSHGMPGFSSSVQGGYYRPVINLAYSIDYWIWGLKPFGFHLTNVLAHTLTGVILYLVILAILGQEPVAFLSAILFLAHPIHTEAVAWISGRGDMFFALFYLLAFLLYIKAGTRDPGGIPGFNRLYLLSGISFVLALQSKEMAITLPLILILYDVCFTYRKRVSNLFRAVKIYIFYFAILGCYLLFRLIILGGVGTGQTLPGNSLLTAFYTTSRIFTGYIWKLLFPINLAVADVVRLANTLIDPAVAGSMLLLFILIAAGIFLYRSRPILSFGIFWFFITLIPVSNFIPALHLSAERFLYLPSAGFCIILASILWSSYSLVKAKRPQLKWSIIAVSAAIPLVYGILTFNRNFDWKDDLTIFSDAVRKSPYTREAYGELGVTYMDMKRYGEAEMAFLAALKERDGYASFVQPQVMRQNLAEIYIITKQQEKSIGHLLWLGRYYKNTYLVQRNLGLAYLKIGRPDWANVKFRQALLTAPHNPKLTEIFQKVIKYSEAAPVKSEDKRLLPDRNIEMIHYDLGIAHLQLREFQEAVAEFSKVLSINPNSRESQYGLARAYKELGYKK